MRDETVKSRLELYDTTSGLAGLFEMVGHPVAVYPDRKLRALAVERGWAVMDGGK